jgi:hypothetical protein
MSGMTDLGIANLALIDLGQPVLVTGLEDSKAGRLFRSSFEPTVREILRAHPWRCARREATLTVDASPGVGTPFNFDNFCALPAGFVRVVRVNDQIDKFEVVGKWLAVNDDAPELTYIKRVETSEFDDLLTSTIAARLTWRWCMAITNSITQTQQAQKDFLSIFADAKFADALDGAPEEPPMGTWAQARLSEA